MFSISVYFGKVVFSESEGLWYWEFQVGFGIHERYWRRGMREREIERMGKILFSCIKNYVGIMWWVIVWWILDWKRLLFIKKTKTIGNVIPNLFPFENSRRLLWSLYIILIFINLEGCLCLCLCLPSQERETKTHAFLLLLLWLKIKWFESFASSDKYVSILFFF